MPSVRIKLIGEVAFQNSVDHSKGYRCNVPTDQFGIPYLPYGEIMAYPARDQYYRVAECIEFLAASTPLGIGNKMFHLDLMKMPVSIRAGHLGARMIHAVLDSVLRQRVEFLARIDREDYKDGISVSELIPTEPLDMLKNLYDPELPDEALVEWYVAGLEEKMDAWDFD